MKTWNKCKLVLSLDNFTKMTVSPDGHSNICRQCVSIQKSESRSKQLFKFDSMNEPEIYSGPKEPTLESLSLVELKNLMMKHNIAIRHMNKHEIIAVLKENNIAYEKIDSSYAKQHVVSRGNRHPKENLRNRARRVMLTNIGEEGAEGEAADDAHNEVGETTIFPSFY